MSVVVPIFTLFPKLAFQYLHCLHAEQVRKTILVVKRYKDRVKAIFSSFNQNADSTPAVGTFIERWITKISKVIVEFLIIYD